MPRCNKNDTAVSCRSFKIVGSGIGYVSPSTSYYKGKDPMSAANKFGSMLFRLINNDSKYSKFAKQDSIKMIMRETTRGSARSTFYYKVERTELPKPVERTLPDGTVIINKYKVKAHKCGDNDSEIKKMAESVPTKPVKAKKEKKVVAKKTPVTPSTKIVSETISM
uniref:Uncharacterized protein n=1 Tax=Pyramimonas orientalis virus TaxID=455367 RepID=A0A7L9AYN3_POV01|nr:hypothetical protein HWQ62_00213 [Pyramimonas orientalis virus]